MHPERVIKLLCEDIILSQPQVGALSCHYIASNIKSNNILIISKEKYNIIVFLFKQNPLLYELIFVIK